MLAPKAEVGSWVSEAAREKFMAAYERAFALWPQPCEEFDVVPGSHGGFDRVDALNDRIAAFIKAHAAAVDLNQS